MSDPRVFYSPREDATPEGELTALAAVYAFVLQAHRQKAAAPATRRRKGVSLKARQGQE
jgi:hypothetical protein